MSRPADPDAGQVGTLTETAYNGTPPYRSYRWTGLPSNCTGTSDAVVSCPWPSPGTWRISVEVVDALGVESSASPPVAVTVLPDPRAGGVVANRSSVDVGQPISFSARALGGTGTYDYVWSGLPAGCLPVASIANCTAVRVGTLNVSVRVEDSNGELSAPSPTTSVPVYADPSVTVTVSPAVVDVAGLLTVTAHVSGGAGGVFYDWSGLPLGCPTNGPLILCAPSFPDVGAYVATVTIIDANLARATSPAVALSVGPALTLEDPMFSGSEIAGSPITFSETSVGGTGPVDYDWSFGDGTYADGASATHTYAAAGNYTVEVRGTDPGGSDRSLEFVIAVNPALASLGPARSVGGSGGLAGWLSAGSFLVGVTAGGLGALLLGRASDALFLWVDRRRHPRRRALPRRTPRPHPAATSGSADPTSRD